MNHKEGAGERKRQRRSLTMTEFPASWLAPESSPSSPIATPNSPKFKIEAGTADSLMQGSVGSSSLLQWIPGASAETDVWALGVTCIELSQGRPPRPEMPILALFGEQRLVSQEAGNSSSSTEGRGYFATDNGGWDSFQEETFGAVGMGMSEEMWAFVARCLTPDPEARPSTQELLEDPFIMQYSKPFHLLH
ncbi:hypothetical protein BC939DRAFT_199116 [Gamsiella multidivaricata]|uniref:uncharacterized protein n=1 Tax=Gamsiella multidivaricata TaxID=101098 RepID=UPI00221E9065|nr:uncharacterized protein BC939DRAFT_199116 [Gamsiella multidivaricata]KAI7821898.1 hypothetical protein BC939DRAFT_199116 [Gamsiella multidivaricata]